MLINYESEEEKPFEGVEGECKVCHQIKECHCVEFEPGEVDYYCDECWKMIESSDPDPFDMN